ncbi:MAG: radical SAM protein [Clostridiales bacterium]|nr:radical SAM protein [Clostridiales bacterium]
MNKKWLLINPPTGNYIRDTRCQASVDDAFAISARPPVDLAYIAGAIEESGDQCYIKDYPVQGFTWDDMLTDLSTLKVNYVVINTTMFSFEEDLRVCEVCKRIDQNIVTIAKGAIFYTDSKKIMSNYPMLDVAVANDEEESLKKIALSIYDWNDIDNITYRKDNRIIKTKTSVSTTLKLPTPKIDEINHALYRRPDTNEKQATIVVGRGCPGKCIYCVAPMVGGHIARYRNVIEIIAEIKLYYYKYGISNFYFSADTFTCNHNWIKEFCAEINKLEFKIAWVCTARADSITSDLIKSMKISGCWGVSIGIESGSNYIQKMIKKNLSESVIKNAIDICRSNRIVTLLHFIIGFPWDSDETVNDTIKLAKKLKGNIIEFYIATPLPGTELYEIVKNDPKLTLIRSPNGLNQSIVTTDTYYLSAKRLALLRKKAIKSIYYNPLFYVNSLLYIRSFSQFIRCTIFFCKKIKNIVLKNRKIRSD